jgi:hypothetical protein
MKDNKSYHGITGADAEQGFSDSSGAIPPSAPDCRVTNKTAQNEIPDRDTGGKGFIERQNVFERI